MAASIEGFVWHDVNSNGDWESLFEVGQEDWIVYVDANENGVWDGAGIEDDFAVTGPDGSYSIGPLPEGTYRVDQVLADGWYESHPSGTFDRLSLAGDGSGTEIAASEPSVSGDGRYVAYESFEPGLVTGDSNGTWDVFVHDRTTGQTERVSLASDGSQGDGASTSPAISVDGRYVAFQSEATNLVPGDTNGQADVFVFDRQTGQIERISIAADGSEGDSASGAPAISATGRFVAYESAASNLVSEDTNDARDIFVYDRETSQVERVSLARTGSQGELDSGSPSISGDGRYVAFESLAETLVPGDADGSSDVFVHDRDTDQVLLVRAPNGRAGTAATIAEGGRFVAFESTDTTTSRKSIFVCDLQADQYEPVSVSSGGATGNSDSLSPSISGDGRYVTFESRATNLVSHDLNGDSDVFVYDRQLDELGLASATGDGVPRFGTRPSISADGSVVVFESAGILGTRNPLSAYLVTVGENETAPGIDFGIHTAIDLGDAPDPGYATLLASGGAYHLIGGPWLGDAYDQPDREADAHPDAAASGDDVAQGLGDELFPLRDDEDGVSIPSLRLGDTVQVSVEVGAGGYVDAWIDFDGNGIWEADEQIHSEFLAAGSHAIPVNAPLDASPGRTFARFRISAAGGLAPTGPAEDGEIEDHPVTIESGLYLKGTGGDDTIVVRAGEIGSTFHEVEINGSAMAFDPALHSSIHIDGFGGNDRVDLYGLDDSDDFFYGMAGVSRLEVDGGAHTFWAANFENVYGHAGTSATVGGDRAYLFGTGSDDTFVASDVASYVTGGGYLHATRQFDAVEADVTGSGGNDKAFFEDTGGDDTYYGEPGRAWMELSSGVTNTALGFAQTRATSRRAHSGGDRAFLGGSDGRDKFIARREIGYLVGTGYLNSAAGFDYVEADVSGTTGEDVAYFFGTDGDDRYYASVSESQMELANGVVNRGVGFASQYAYAGAHDLGDAAFLSGSPGDDTFAAGDGFAYISGSGVLTSTRKFESVEAEVTAEGNDVAALCDSDGADRFFGMANQSRFELSSGAVNVAKGPFDRVYAHGTLRTADEAYLSGTSEDDVFVAGETYAYLAGDGSINAVRRFDYVEANVAGSGGTDRATFEDSSGDDIYYGETTQAWIDLSSGIVNRAVGFASTRAVSMYGGLDLAFFTDSSGDDDYYGGPEQARIDLSNGASNLAVGFARTEVVSTGSAARGDWARLVGGQGQDKFFGRWDVSYMTGPGYWNRTAGFEYVEADVTGTAGDDWAYFFGTDGDDTFFGAATESRMELANGVENRGIGFANYSTHAAGHVDGDLAFLTGSPNDDVFVAGDGFAYLYGAGILNSTRDFEYVEASVNDDGFDSATLLDTPGADLFFGALEESLFVLDSGVVNAARGAFDRVFALGTTGTADRAYLAGTADNDTFVAGESYEYLAGDGKTNSLRRFDYVEADVSESGGTDTATLIDSSLEDFFFADGDEAGFRYGNGSDASRLARGFARVNAVAVAGGPDRRDDDLPHSFTLHIYGTEWEIPGSVYWLGEGTIHRNTLDSSDIETLLRYSETAVPLRDIEVDAVSGTLYYSSVGIMRANLDGTGVEYLGIGVDGVDLALDTARGKIYWTESSAGDEPYSLWRANLDGSEAERIPVTVSAPTALEIDVEAGMLYWADKIGDEAVIRRSSLDGSAVEDVVRTQVGSDSIGDISLNPLDGTVYWTMVQGNAIYLSLLDGTGLEQLLSADDGIDGPIGIDLDVTGGCFYFTQSNGVWRAKLDGTGNKLVAASETRGKIAFGPDP